MASGASRDLGLQRIATGTRFLAVGALVAGGVLSAAVAKALPGKSNHPAATPTTNTVSPSQTPAFSTPSGDDSGVTGSPLTAPSQAPQPTTASPLVSSGGS